MQNIDQMCNFPKTFTVTLKIVQSLVNHKYRGYVNYASQDLKYYDYV